MPHIAAFADADPEEMTDVSRAYLIGYADAQAECIRREAAALTTLDDVRTFQDRVYAQWEAGEIDTPEWERLDLVAAKALEVLEAAHVPPEDCPEWCNAHGFTYGAWSPDDDLDNHRHLVEVAGSTLEIEPDDKSGALEMILLLPQVDTPLSLPEARRVAVAILTACAVVESTS